MCKGWIKDHRQEMWSSIWEMPPFYHRVWQYLKYSACYEEKKIPMADGDTLKLFSGQILTSLRNISSSIGWYERGIRKEPNPKTVQDVLDWLEKQDMITIDHGRSGKQFTLITIVNWNKYQADEALPLEIPSEGNTPESDEKQTADIYKNNKEYKEREEDKKDIDKNMCDAGEDSDIINEPEAQSNERDKYSKNFEDFWSIYPRKVEKKKAYRVWKARIRDKVCLENLISAASNYAAYCRLNELDVRYMKHPGTFLGPDKPYEEFVNGYPLSDTIPKNIKSALEINKRVNDGEQMEVQLW